MNRLAFALVGGFATLAVAGPWLAPYPPEALDLLHPYASPSPQHLLGTGENGIDLLSAVLHGARLAGVVGVSVTLISLTLGTLLGLIAGLLGGIVDHTVMGFADIMQAFPALLLHVLILALMERPQLIHLVFALSVSGWVLYARLARASALSLREQTFVTAAVALGASRSRVLLRHLLPNASGPLVVQASSGIGATILAEASLSFLGLSPASASSWGGLLDQGSAVMLVFPQVTLFSGAAVALTVLGFNWAGDAMQDRRQLHA